MAVAAVLDPRVPPTLVPYEAAREVLITEADLDRLAGNGPTGAWVCELPPLAQQE